MTPPFRYHAVNGDVFLIRDAAPDLWQRVATFVSADRASDYAEVENMMIGDFKDEAPRYETLEAPVVEPLPQSSVTVERVRSVQVSDKTAVIETPTVDWAKVDEAIRAFWPTEMSVAEIARRTGVSSPTVHKHARDMGLGPRGVPAPEMIVDAARSDAIMRAACSMPPKPLKMIADRPLTQEADDLWLFVSDLDGEIKQSQWSAESGISVPVIKTATAELLAAGIMTRVATGALTVTELHPQSEAAKVPEEEPPPPTGCLLNQLEIVKFRERWAAGDAMREIAEEFGLTTIEVAETRKKLKMPDRVRGERLST